MDLLQTWILVFLGLQAPRASIPVPPITLLKNTGLDTPSTAANNEQTCLYCEHDFLYVLREKLHEERTSRETHTKP